MPSSRRTEGYFMETAFVLIKALPMKERDVYASLLQMDSVVAVSYTHLTLPTIYSV